VACRSEALVTKALKFVTSAVSNCSSLEQLLRIEEAARTSIKNFLIGGVFLISVQRKGSENKNQHNQVKIFDNITVYR
jgi:hypothetical protein